jgi:hypothetical protein
MFYFIAIVAISCYLIPLLLIPIATIHYLLNLCFPFLINKPKYWTFCAKLFIKMLNVKIILLEKSYPRIIKGFILANHRSMFDAAFDPLINDSIVIGRYKATMSMLFFTILGYFENRIISIRKYTKRNQLFNKIKNFLSSNDTINILFFPEAMRKNHTFIENMEDTKKLIRPGLLKSIYEYNETVNKPLPIQIVITKNKESVINEKTFCANFNQTLYIKYLKPIYTTNYETFTDFYNNFCQIWFDEFNYIYVNYS